MTVPAGALELSEVDDPFLAVPLEQVLTFSAGGVPSSVTTLAFLAGGGSDSVAAATDGSDAVLDI